MTNSQNAPVDRSHTNASTLSAHGTGGRDAPPLQFVPYDSRQQGSRSHTLTIIRSQAMRDHVWKENHPFLASNKATGAVGNPPKGPNQIGRFRLKPKRAAVSTRSRNKKEKKEKFLPKDFLLGSLLQHQILSGQQVTLASRVNLFDAALLNLGPESERLIFYYHQAYTMNMVALDFKDDCLSNSVTNLALLHAILYIVCTDLDMKQGVFDSALSAHHGAEAIRLINQSLAGGGMLIDSLIAAVAIIATRENLNGRFQLANMHMTGLQHMIMQRGGIQNIQGIHKRVATWSDFCDSNIRNQRLRFCQPPLAPRMLGYNVNTAGNNLLDPDDVLGAASPVVPVIQELRRVSMAMDPEYPETVDKTLISQTIYGIEYDLALLNGTKSGANQLQKDLSHEDASIKIACHIYLYLMIRQIPSISPILDEHATRLRLALELQKGKWWVQTRDFDCWLLWILFMGYAGASGGRNKQWFLQNAVLVRQALNLTTMEDFRLVLKKVMWSRTRCEDYMKMSWQSISLRTAESRNGTCSCIEVTEM